MKKKEERLTITFDKNCADFIMGALEGVVPRWECFGCGTKITKKNLGAITQEGVFCGNIVCLIKYVETRG